VSARGSRLMIAFYSAADPLHGTARADGVDDSEIESRMQIIINIAMVVGQPRRATRGEKDRHVLACRFQASAFTSSIV
jgi:hypothetical protein